MITYQKLISVAFSFCLLANLATAQQSQGESNAELRIQKNTTELTKQLGLNEKQAAEVAKINTDFREQIISLKTSKIEETAKRSKMQSLKKEKKMAIKAILTPEQLTKYEALPKGRRGKHMGKGHRGGKAQSGHRKQGQNLSKEEYREKRMAKLTEDLSLDDKQVSMISAINKKYTEKLKGLTGQTEDREKTRVTRQTIKAEKIKEIKAVLNPEQLSKFQAKLAEKESRHQNRMKGPNKRSK